MDLGRRDFLRISAYVAALLGLESTWIPKIAASIEKKRRLPVIWLNFQTCTGCTESFIQSSHPVITDIVLNLISLDFNETIQAAAGDQAEEALHNSIKENTGNYILVIEGAIPTADNGVYCTIAGRSAIDVFTEAYKSSLAVITFGTCASFGGIQAASPNPTGAVASADLVKGKPVIRVPGCPPIGEVATAVVAHYLVFGKIPKLDEFGRPEAFYKKRIHDTCYRRQYFDNGVFAESFEDPSGCLYMLGCKGPISYNACSIMRWHNGTSFPIQSGHPCIACSEKGFWDFGPFYKRLPEVPGFGVHTTVDKIGLGLAGLTAAAFAAHGAISIARRLKETKNEARGAKV